MDLDGPLDFEDEDPLVNPPPAIIEKRKKVIGLDDLLSDFYKEKSKLIDKQNKKKRKVSKVYDSDDDDEQGKVAKLSQCVDEVHNQMNEIAGEEDYQEWGLSMFGDQKTPIPSPHVDLDSCYLLKEFMNNQLNLMVGLIVDEGTTFLEGLLVNGLLTRLILTCARVEKLICKWTLNILLYSLKEDLRSSACDFWCSILLSQNEVNGAAPVEINWLPNYQELKEALETYGFRINSSQDVELTEADSESQGPPQNIRAWLKLVTACCQIRCKNPIFSTSQDSDENLLSSLMSINLKEKGCNLFKTYIFVVLAENWLFSSKLVEEKPVLRDMWAVFLRYCSCQINSTDLRPYASKVRTKAAYLLQGCSSN
ncbi:PREDICTED: uncharacterized protein LOC104753458 [Camelina sativa]|uniref:Uncharacterized protein LOC104753458 n=1 Tax=Camelina sativa TaxID=90675 RepID=A0ABM0WP67_CAMSA|nr:PREDICTED: uncharacterized protein LOC104753458 [Camelina sativa]